MDFKWDIQTSAQLLSRSILYQTILILWKTESELYLQRRMFSKKNTDWFRSMKIDKEGEV